MKKDWQENKRRRKEQESLRMNSVSKKGKGAVNGDPTVTLSEGDPEPEYDCEIDEMRCMLYFHGGGYYFGSIDQERLVSSFLTRLCGYEIHLYSSAMLCSALLER